MSTYANDPRVVENGDGTYSVSDPASGDWLIGPVDGGYIAGSLFGAVTDPSNPYSQRAKVFPDADDAIRAAIGGPQ